MQGAVKRAMGLLQKGGYSRIEETPDGVGVSKLGAVIDDLGRLNRNTEQAFVAIGGKLISFSESVNQISAELGALVQVVSGEQTLRATEVLRTVLEEANQMAAHADAGACQLERMKQGAHDLRDTLSGFHGTASTFRTLGVLTRIETARLGNAGAEFGSLADDVNQLAGNVKARVEAALEKAAHLLPSIERSMHEVSLLEDGQMKGLPEVVSGVLASLSSFGEMQQRVHANSVRLSEHSAIIVQDFNRLIVSIQFHDITRQQVEHVVEVLRCLMSEVKAEEDEAGQVMADIGCVLALQSLQLASAAAKFRDAVSSVGISLADIAGQILAMAGESGDLAGLSAHDPDSALHQLEEQCDSILLAFSGCAAAEKFIQGASDGLTNTICETKGPIEEIRAIELQVHHMALNARINATRLGPAGEALSVLAAEMQQLSADCRQRSELLSASLSAMTSAAGGLSGQARDDRLLNGLSEAVQQVHSSKDHSARMIEQIVQHSQLLSADMSITREGFRVGESFAEAITSAMRILNEVGEANRPGISGKSPEELEQGLSEFARRYTMQSERDVHNGLTGVVAAAGTDASSSGQQEDENIEFF